MNEIQLSNDLNVITAEINSYKQVAGQAIFEIGRRLKHVKENDLLYGEWGDWLEQIQISRGQATKFITVYEELGEDDSTWNKLGTQALYHIATLPPEEREKEHTLSSGETKKVDEMTVRELQEVKRKLKQTEQQAEIERKERERLERENEQLASRKPKVIEKEVVKEIDKTDYESIKRLEEQLERERKAREQAEKESQQNSEALNNYMNSYVKPEQERKSKIIGFTNDLSVGVSNLASNIEKAKQRLDGTINNDEQVIQSIERAIESLKDYIITLDEMKGSDVIEVQ